MIERSARYDARVADADSVSISVSVPSSVGPLALSHALLPTIRVGDRRARSSTFANIRLVSVVIVIVVIVVIVVIIIVDELRRSVGQCDAASQHHVAQHRMHAGATSVCVSARRRI